MFYENEWTGGDAPDTAMAKPTPRWHEAGIPHSNQMSSSNETEHITVYFNGP